MTMPPRTLGLIEAADQDEIDDLRAEDNARRRYRNQLLQHPNPQDPDYPGDDDEAE